MERQGGGAPEAGEDGAVAAMMTLLLGIRAATTAVACCVSDSKTPKGKRRALTVLKGGKAA